MKLLLFIVSLLAAILPGTSLAHKMAERDFTCPIDGHTWKQKVDISGSQFGRRLDLKPLGAIAAPWTVPQCPKCRFVIYGNDPGKMPIEKLKPYILSEPYQTASKDQPTHFCIALIQGFLGAGPLDIGHAFLSASWQTESKPEECRKHLESALTHFKTALETLEPGGKQFQTASILCGELERRTQRFDEARKRCDALLASESFKDPNVQNVLKRELEFITKKDAAPHAMTAEQEHLVKE